MSKFGIYTRDLGNVKRHVCDVIVKSAAHAVNHAQIILGYNADYFIVPR